MEKDSRLANNLNTILVTVLSGITTACAIAVVLFLMHLTQKVPKIEQGQERMEKKIDDMQNSINDQGKLITGVKEEQIGDRKDIDNLKDRIIKH